MAPALILISVLAQSPEAEWELPPASEPAPLPEPPPAAPTAPARAKAEVKKPAVAPPVPVPDPRRFNWGHVALAVMAAGGQSGYYALRVELGASIGVPWRMKGTQNRAMGWTLGVGSDLLAAKLQVGSCGSAGVCGSRYQGGLAVRGAWNWGVIGSDAIVAPIHEVFVQAVGFLSNNQVPSAPLAPGGNWNEHGLRVDLGGTSGILRGSIWPRDGAFSFGGGLYAAVSLEWIITPTVETGRFRGGFSLGLGI